MLGRVLVAERQAGAAMPELRKALELDANLQGARLLLGSALRQEGFIAEAISQLRQAEAQEPGSAEVQYELGVALYGSGAQPEAVHCLEREAIELNPNFALARGDLGQLR